MSRLTKFSLFGAVIAALCCFTPLLVWILAAIGLAGLIAYLDLVLLPLLGLFVLLALWGLVRDRKAA
ncbi:MAG: mercury resistance system transport protein MerF [Rhizobiaceae bacterium]|nr:mercury resistance system transport protein MerF [Hyphomicrobiales bacterium]NRB30168.1 mercury resistance system transport protein MerF [Rhizobiaceae bacterium]